MGTGIVGWGAYLPYWRLTHQEIGSFLGAGGGRGSRSVASFDEDPTTMAVGAARPHVRGGEAPTVVMLATAAPPYLDKTNAAAVHAALGLGRDVAAYDLGGAVRSGVGALRAGLAMAAGGERVLLAISDTRTGLPGGVEERSGGDAAAAFVLGPKTAAELVGHGHATAEFLDRWRTPGDVASGVWEERFAEEAYAPLAELAIQDALKPAGIAGTDLDHVVVAGPHLRAVRAAVAAVGARPEALVPNLVDVVGNCGSAHLGLLLSDALDRAEPDQWILAVSVADGADALLLRTTPALADAQRAQRAAGRPLVRELVEAGRDDLRYPTFLTWRQLLQREAPRRPDPAPPAGPPSQRATSWKFGFVGSRCDVCDTRHLPPSRVCVKCRSKDQMTPECLADVRGTVVTYTVDRLAYTLSPPVVAAVIDFDGGARFSCELTDLQVDEARIGLRVEMTFRRLHTARGVHNYFWKARPIRSNTPGSE